MTPKKKAKSKKAVAVEPQQVEAVESEDTKEAKPRSGLSGVIGLWQWILGGEAKSSFGTMMMLTCMLIPMATCLSVTALLLGVAFGKVRLPTALSVIRLLVLVILADLIQ